MDSKKPRNEHTGCVDLALPLVENVDPTGDGQEDGEMEGIDGRKGRQGGREKSAPEYALLPHLIIQQQQHLTGNPIIPIIVTVGSCF